MSPFGNRNWFIYKVLIVLLQGSEDWDRKSGNNSTWVYTLSFATLFNVLRQCRNFSVFGHYIDDIMLHYTLMQ